MNPWLIATAISGIENGWSPDWLTRAGIRRLCGQRRASLPATTQQNQVDWDETAKFIAQMDASEIAVETTSANQQHYEVPSEFFDLFLGPRRKYSSCIWDQGVHHLSQAEDRSLAVTCQRAQVQDAMRILDLGCGWGSLSLYLLEKFPNVEVTSVSNSASQRKHIIGQAEQRGFANRLNVITADMNQFSTEAKQFDRVMSIEMFEHMRNHRQLLGRIRDWLRPDGKLFIHIFCHRSHPYFFEVDGPANWMGRYFFTGGMMPSYELLERFDDVVELQEKWEVNGVHYGKTLDAWLALYDLNSIAVKKILRSVYPAQQQHQWFHRWRIFLMASSELFRYDQGKSWFVAHYLFTPKQ